MKDFLFEYIYRRFRGMFNLFTYQLHLMDAYLELKEY
ncbi:hypothetical protein B0O79_3027 [Flavobacteriaceae bacterium MAR_2009_75]|nr:hypothetical protein B0O79_3027 [Flavobacteriaceae bacterium MAR_2009_75]